MPTLEANLKEHTITITRNLKTIIQMKYRNYSLDTTRKDKDKCKKLQSIIYNETGIDIKDNTRKQEAVALRKIYYKLLTTSTKMSYTSIGRTVNKKHCTVIHALNTFDWDYENDKQFKKLYDKLFYIYTEGKNVESKDILMHQNLLLQETINELREQLKEARSNTIRPRNQQTKIYAGYDTINAF